MMKFTYTLFNPSGNITALVETPVPESDRLNVAKKIMNSEPSCEQVGFLSYNDTVPNTVFLNMAGGEFCANASMCAAMLSGMQYVKCSGNPEFMRAEIFDEVCCLHMTNQPEGITHYVLEESMPDEDAEKLIKTLSSDAAVGLMFLSGNYMRPLVYVPRAETLFWENSCASGSIAAGIYLYKKNGAPVDKDLIQPGGIINVKVSENGIVLTERITKVYQKEGEFR